MPNETHEIPKCTVIKHSVQTKNELRDLKKISGNGKVQVSSLKFVVTLENWLKIQSRRLMYLNRIVARVHTSHLCLERNRK